MRTKLLTGLLFIGTLLSCDSEKDTAPAPAPAPEPAPIKTFDFSFRYDTHMEGAKDFELILSQEDGKVVLDTLIAFNTDHKLRIKSGDTKYDLTTVLFNAPNNSYWVETYVQVNPDKWHLRYSMTSNTSPIEREKAEVTYTNIPNDKDMYFWSKGSTGYMATWNAGTLKFANYTRSLPTDLAYIILPNYGKYMFTELTSNKTTVDFTEAGNTGKRKYTKPAGITNFRTYLYGYTKEDEKTKQNLYSSLISLSNEYDLHFPPTGIEVYDLEVTYTDAGSYLHSYKYYGNQIPTEIDFAPTSDFSVSTSGFEDFTVTFTDDKPSIYNMYWAATDASFDARWNVYSSPEKSSFKPKAFLEGLKSKTLEGKNVSAFKLSYVRSQKMKDHSYQAILDIMANPALSLYKEVKQSRIIRKLF
ncbi:hypothetical protein [Pontibacter ruber]|uniref:Lipoprotein n=1 Tax=Pontibacter ruber TaxID=1343895 RepID=A0ABW5CYP0_9BACT|nr:hypothetical protein [Pontibacter ruber]